MKQCPTCNRTYTDEALSFCLDDGTPLLSASSQPPSFDPNATLQYNPARETNPPPTQVYQPTPPPTPSWTPTPQVGGMMGAPPQKKSKALFWILGGVAALVVIGIGAVVLVVVLAGMAASNANNANNVNNSNNSNRVANTNNANNSNANKANTNTSDPGKNYLVQDDFSTAKWWVGSNVYGKGEYVNGQYQLNAGTSGGYVVVYGPKLDQYHTENATTRVTARSVTGTSPAMGYGLAVYGELKDGNLEDYAFLIRTDESPAFRIALHKGGKETTLVSWTPSSQIRSGSSPNQLEVRADDKQLSFYINGQFARSIPDSAGYKRGFVGFYTSDTEPVAFDDLEIVK